MSTKTIALALLVLTLAWLAAGCSDKENAFDAARALEATGVAQASAPSTPAPAQAAQTAAVSAGDEAEPAAGNAARGQTLFSQQGCVACHSPAEAAIVGPGMKGVAVRAGSRVPGLSARDYLSQSIREPASFVVPGFNNLMPSIFASLPQEDIDDLIAYLESLK